MSAETSPIVPLVAGNWKMNGVKGSIGEAEAVSAALGGIAGVEVMICPPATLVMALATAVAGGQLKVGGQDCHVKASGAHTGDVSAEMLRDAGAGAVIAGHSERRTDHGDTDSIVKAKALAARRAGLTAIVCVGESAGERRAGLTLDVVGRQLAGSLPEGATATDTVVAYEPVWAIGTGLVPTLAEVAEVHGAIRSALSARFGREGGAMRILYGGSVNPGNAHGLMRVAHVNGALVGGASLKASDFLAIVRAAQP